MFKVGDIVKTRNINGGSSFKVIQILNETHMLVHPLQYYEPHHFAVKWADWDLDPIQHRKNKITKILGNIEK